MAAFPTSAGSTSEFTLVHVAEMRIGVISDTHNYFDPKIPGIFQEVDHILHAGDIGSPRILLELEAIAPVTAVEGNTDESGFRYAQTALVELGGRRFLVHHIVQPMELSEPLRARILRDQPHVVVFGHTHRPFCETIEHRLFFNPGYAGKSRFGMERTVAILNCTEAEMRPEYFTL